MTEREHDESTLKVAIGLLVAHMRSKAGLSIREVASEIGYDFSYVHKVETGELASDAVMQCLDKLFEMDGTLTELVHVARKGSVQDYATRAANREFKAERIQVINSAAIPSLMRTRSYARAVLRTEWPKGPEEKIEAAVTEVLNRQSVFDREEPPLYWAIIDEGALH
jgi:transcriptional regulator with XRE-family HTH domain